MQIRSLLAGNDAMSLLEIMHASLNCDTEPDFIGLFARMQKLFSFDFACAFLGCRQNNEVVMVDAVNISYPPDFYRIYMSKKYLRIDHVVERNFKNYAVQYWMTDKKRLVQSKELIALAADCGMKTGYVHGSKPFGPRQYGSFFSFAGAAVKPETRTAAILELVIPYLHLTLSQIHQRKQSVNPVITLSKRESEVLNWVKQGKSSWDISVILHISERTVNFHIYNTMCKLGTINRSQMVAVASQLGLIDIN